MSKMWILFRKSFSEFHEAITFQNFYLPYVYSGSNLII